MLVARTNDSKPLSRNQKSAAKADENRLKQLALQKLVVACLPTLVLFKQMSSLCLNLLAWPLIEIIQDGLKGRIAQNNLFVSLKSFLEDRRQGGTNNFRFGCTANLCKKISFWTSSTGKRKVIVWLAIEHLRITL